MTAKRVAWSLWGTSVSLLITGMVFGLMAGIPAEEASFVVLLPALVLTFATVGVFVGSRHPTNPIGWIFLGVALLWAVATSGSGFAEYVAERGLAVSEWVRIADWLGSWIFLPGIYIPVTFLFLLYPTGRLPSRRWNTIAWVSAVGIVTLTTASAFRPGRLEDAVILRSNPYALGNSEFWDLFGFVSFVLGFLGLLGSVAALVSRFRRSSGEQRQQMKWLAAAAVAVAVLFVLASFSYGFLPDSQTFTILTQSIQLLALLLIPIAAGVAILKYRLYDIDVVINKTIVFGSLAAFITGIYVAIVVGIGALLGSQDEPNLALSIGATAIVAIAFSPVKERTQRLANRLVYGHRLSPYEVLADLSRMAATAPTPDDVIQAIAHSATLGVNGQGATVTLYMKDEMQVIKTHPQDFVPAGSAVGESQEVIHEGARLGTISIHKAAGSITPQDRKLLDDLSKQSGLVFHNARLTLELQARLDQLSAQAEELQSSRARIVSASHDARRRLERDITQGPRKELLTLRGGLRDAQNLMDDDPDAAASVLEALTARANETLDALRDLARGIYPPLLTDKGIVPALEAHIRKLDLPVTLHSDGAENARFDESIETTVYFCSVEVLSESNGEGTSNLSIDLTSDQLELAMDRVSLPESTWASIRDRVEAVGGFIESVDDHMAIRVPCVMKELSR